jgi:hypothetical protein
MKTLSWFKYVDFELEQHDTLSIFEFSLELEPRHFSFPKPEPHKNFGGATL